MSRNMNGQTMFAALAAKMPGAVHELGTNHDEWAAKARLNWDLKASDVAYSPDGKRMLKFEGRRILFRDDTDEALSVVGKRFKPVQPKEILNFYGELAERYGFKMAIAGSTENGCKIWAIAETPHTLEVIKGDKVSGGLFMATACDGTMSTQAYFTSFRLWCTNQLPVLARIAKKGAAAPKAAGAKVFRITHSTVFNSSKVHQDLELMQSSWEDFGRMTKALAAKKVTKAQVIRFFQDLYYKGEDKLLTEEQLAEMRTSTALARVLHSYEHGAGQKEIAGTAWALVNAVTHYMDHDQKVKDESIRVKKAWMDGGRFKAQVFTKALELT